MKTITRTLVLVALALPVTAALALPAAATRPQPQRIEMAGTLTGPSTAAGSWLATGFVTDSGTYTETFRFAGRTIHVEKVLVGSRGTIVLEGRGVVVWTSACTATFSAGSWRIVDGTGAYARLKGGGSPVTTPDSFGDVCTGVVRITHVGSAHSD